MIQIISLSEVHINGENAGQLMDVLRNHPELAADVQRAFNDYAARENQTNTEYLNAHFENMSRQFTESLEAERREFQSKLEKAKADEEKALDECQKLNDERLNKTVAEMNAVLESVRSELVQVTAERDAFGTTDEAKAILKANRIRDLQQELERLSA